MCLVTFLPTPDGFVLSSNRDESPARSAHNVLNEEISDSRIYYPADTSGGSWIILSSDKRVICLLNGAFENHQRLLPYRKSRGVMMKEYYEYSDAIKFFEYYDFTNIEPFTMIIAEDGRLYEFRWDANIKHVRELDPNSIHAWSSCTLYDDKASAKRAILIKSRLMSCESSDLDALKEAHLHRDSDDLYNGLYMDRAGIVQTISHTQVVYNRSTCEMHYHNLLGDRTVR